MLKVGVCRAALPAGPVKLADVSSSFKATSGHWKSRCNGVMLRAEQPSVHVPRPPHT